MMASCFALVYHTMLLSQQCLEIPLPPETEEEEDMETSCEEEEEGGEEWPEQGVSDYDYCTVLTTDRREHKQCPWLWWRGGRRGEAVGE